MGKNKPNQAQKVGVWASNPVPLFVETPGPAEVDGKSGLSSGKGCTNELRELEDICYHQEHHPGRGGLPQPKAWLKSGGKPPPPFVPLRLGGRPLEPMGRVCFPKLQSNLWCDLLTVEWPKQAVWR